MRRQSFEILNIKMKGDAFLATFKNNLYPKQDKQPLKSYLVIEKRTTDTAVNVAESKKMVNVVL